MSYSISGRTSPFIIFSIYGLHFLRTSLVGSTFVSMTYSIDIRPYNDPYIKITEEAIGCCRALGSWCFHHRCYSHLEVRSRMGPGANFQSKAAVIRKHAATMRNTPFAATEELLSFSGKLAT